MSAFDSHQTAALRGQFFESGRGRDIAAILRIAEGQVIVTDTDTGAPLARLPRADVDISDRLGALARRLTFPDGAVFITSDNDGVDRLVGTSLSDISVNWLEKFHPRLIMIAVITIAMVVGLYRFGLPLLVSGAVAVTPNTIIKTISKASLAGFEDRLLLPTTVEAARREKLTSAFNDLVAHSSDQVKSLEPTLRFHASLIGPNAFALPDGTIVITDALLKLIGDEAAIGILGHELGHVRHQHGLRLIYRSAGMVALISLVAGDVGGILEDILLQGAGLLALSYNRNFERQADAYSVKLMKQTGHDPLAIIAFFSKLGGLEEKGSLIPDWLSTHPGSAERVQYIKKLAAES